MTPTTTATDTLDAGRRRFVLYRDIARLKKKLAARNSEIREIEEAARARLKARVKNHQ